MTMTELVTFEATRDGRRRNVKMTGDGENFGACVEDARAAAHAAGWTELVYVDSGPFTRRGRLHSEWGVFNGEGAVSGPHATRNAAENAMHRDDPDGESELEVLPVCPDHPDQAAFGCEHCND